MTKIDILTISKPETFFYVERNELNNKYMVHSMYAQLPQCFVYSRKREAAAQCEKLNQQASNEYLSFIQQR